MNSKKVDSIMILSDNPFIAKEIEEFLHTENINSYHADTPERLIHLISNHSIDMVIIDMKTLKNTEIIRYINKYHQGISVILHTDDYLFQTIHVLKKGTYQLLDHPFHLNQLQKYIKE